MASSTPPPHYSLTTSKPYQNQNHHHHNHRQTHQNWTSQKVSLNNRSSHTPTTRNAAKPPPGPTTTTTNPSFPSLSSLPPSKSELSADFSGRRSTRFVSKMHFGRPKTAVASRHTSTAEEALHQAIRHSGDDRHIDGLLLNFEQKLCGTDDYTFLLRELGNRGEYSMAIRCFEFAVRRERRRNEQGKLASSMISVLGRLGKVDLAKKVFDTAAREGYGNTVYAYSALISAYAKSGFCNEAIKVFETMKNSGLKPNLVTYNALIDACGKGGADFNRASEIFDEMLRNGVQPDRITFNSLLAVCSGAGLWETAKNLFSEMVYRGIDQDIYTYNTLLDVACNGGHMHVASGIMSEMHTKNILPNEVTYSTMIRGCAKAGRLDKALSLFNEMKFARIKLDRVSYNTLLAIYASLGSLEEALSVGDEMESMGIKKDVVTYNALLDGFGKQGKYHKVKQLFQEMKAERLSPNLLTYSTLISVYSKGGLYREAMEVYKEFKQEGLKADVVFYSKLIDALCKKGLVESSALLLEEMTEKGIQPNVVTYNSIINAFGQSATGECLEGANESPAESSNSVVIRDAIRSRIEYAEDDRIINIFEELAAENSCHSKKHNRGKQELKKLRSMKLSKMSSLKPSAIHVKTRFDQAPVESFNDDDSSEQGQIEFSRTSPNYLKPTSFSDAKKASSQEGNESDSGSVGSSSSSLTEDNGIRGGTELRKTLKKSRSIRLGIFGSLRPTSRRAKSRFDQPHSSLSRNAATPPTRKADASPHYWKATSCSEGKKMHFQASLHDSESNFSSIDGS